MQTENHLKKKYYFLGSSSTLSIWFCRVVGVQSEALLRNEDLMVRHGSTWFDKLMIRQAHQSPTAHQPLTNRSPTNFQNLNVQTVLKTWQV